MDWVSFILLVILLLAIAVAGGCGIVELHIQWQEWKRENWEKARWKS